MQTKININAITLYFVFLSIFIFLYKQSLQENFSAKIALRFFLASKAESFPFKQKSLNSLEKVFRIKFMSDCHKCFL